MGLFDWIGGGSEGKEVYTFKLKTDKSEKLTKEVEEAIKKGLKKAGAQAEGYAKGLCPVDTGLLRNSITYGLGGEYVKKPNYKSEKKHATTEATKRAGTAGKKVSPVKQGKLYQGEVERVGSMSVTLGTNVEYAPYVELGSSSTGTPRPFIQPAMRNHMGEYMQMIEEELKKVKV